MSGTTVKDRINNACRVEGAPLRTRNTEGHIFYDPGLHLLNLKRQNISFPVENLSSPVNFSPGPLPLDPQRKEELPTGEVPQLATRSERGPDDVRHVQNGEDGALHERPGDSGTPGGVSLSRLGPQGNQQRLSDEDRIAAGDSVYHEHDGTPPFRPVRHDPQHGQQ